MKIYTKTGDKGITSLFDGTRVPKNHIRVSSYGSIDELNSILGIVIAQDKKNTIHHDCIRILKQIQSDLFEIGAILAHPSHTEDGGFIKKLPERVQAFENEMDTMTDRMPELTNFILPGGGLLGAQLQLARAVSRRAEREVISLLQQEKVQSEIIQYLNRLSDLLFTLSRFVNFKEKEPETSWISQNS